jgi:hypothetical protein
VRRLIHGAGFPLCAIFVLSTVGRIYVGTLRPTPLYYPDEYIYTSLARSISATGIPSLRGAKWHFPSFLGPYLMSPAWWISDVRVAYHVVLGLGAVWFSAAAFPAYGLAKRIGVTTRGALIVALFAVLVPDAAFASSALTEPYAYPVFLTTILVAVDALAFPTNRRQLLALLMMAILCLVRIQFAVFPLSYLAAAIVEAQYSLRQAARAQWVVLAGLGAAFAAVAAVGVRRVAGFYSDFATMNFPLSSIWEWFGFSLFVLFIAAGWAVIPGSVISLRALIGADDRHRRSFAVLTLSTSVTLLAVATYSASIHSRVYERYDFYAAPLLVIAFLWGLEAGITHRAYAPIAYVLAVLAIIVPATASLHSSDTDQSPSLLGLHTLGGGGRSASLVWAIGLAVGAALVAMLRSRPVIALLQAALIACSVSVAATHALLEFVPDELRAAGGRPIDTFSLAGRGESSLVTWPGTDRFILMKTLFWSPHIDRVLVIGGGSATDGFSSMTVRPRAGNGVVDDTGRPVRGPFALAVDTTVAEPHSFRTSLPTWPSALIFGLDREDHVLNTLALLIVEPGARSRIVTLHLNSRTPRTLTVKCPDDRIDIRLGHGTRRVSLLIPASRVTQCSISLTRGAAVQSKTRITSGVKVVSFTVSRGAA